MAEMKTLNGFVIVDAKAREDISALQKAADLSNYYTKAEVDALIPSHEGLATKDFVTQAIQNALNAIGVAEGGAY